MIQAVASETGGPIVVMFTFVRSSAAKRSLSTFGGFLILAAVMLSSLNGLAETDYYRHAFFDNSIAPDNYYYSGGQAVLPSTVESIEGQLPWKPTYFFRLRMPCASSGARCQEAVGMQRCEWLTCHDGKLEMTFPAHLYCVESRFLPSWLVGSVERMEPTTRLELVTCRLRLQTLDVF